VRCAAARAAAKGGDVCAALTSQKSPSAGCELGNESRLAIGAALEKNSTLTTLYLIRCELGDESGKAIGAALEKNSTLTTLVLQCAWLIA